MSLAFSKHSTPYPATYIVPRHRPSLKSDLASSRRCLEALVCSVTPEKMRRRMFFPSCRPLLLFPLVGPRLAIIQLGQLGETVESRRRHLLVGHPPGPVAAGRAGHVHARLRTEVEHVLHRHDGEIGHRTPGRADQVPD